MSDSIKDQRDRTAGAAGYGTTWLKASSSALILMIAASGSVSAQDADDDADVLFLPELVVTAQKREESAQDVPISLSVLTSTDIERFNIHTIEDYFLKVPNVHFTSLGTQAEVDLSIRGITEVGGVNQPVGVFIDDFGLNFGGFRTGFNQDLQDIERIEVARGPQGTLYGRNVFAGAINVITKKPNEDLYVEATAQFESFNTQFARGIVNIPISDRVFFRGAMYWGHSDGFIRNLAPVGGTDFTNRLGGRGAVRILVTDRLTIDLATTVTHENGGFASRVSTGLFNPRTTFFDDAQDVIDFIDNNVSCGAECFIGVDISGMRVDESGFIFPPSNDKADRVTNQSFPRRREFRNIIGIGRADYEADSFTVTGIGGVIDSKFRSLKDDDISTVLLDLFASTRSITGWSAEVRALSTDHGFWDWLVGAWYSENETISRPIFINETNLGVNAIESFNSKARHYAFFGELTVRPFEDLTLVAGMRYSHDREITTDAGSFPDPRPPFDQFDVFSPELFPLIGVEFPFEFSDPIIFQDSVITPRFTATYAWSDDLTTYFSAGKGYKHGGTDGQGNTFRNDTVWNYEGGVKAVLAGGRLATNTAVFYMDWSDVQIDEFFFNPESPQDFGSTTGNGGDARIWGVELDAQWVPTENLLFTTAVGYLNAEWTNGFEELDIDGDGNEEPVPLDGQRLQFAPKWTASVTGEYSRPVWREFDGFLLGEWSYVGGIKQLGIVVDPITETVPDYNVLNIRAGIRSDRWSLTVYAENALNKAYYTRLRSIGLNMAGLQADIHPRVIGARLTYRLQPGDLGQ